jgi:hypothetical protein
MKAKVVGEGEGLRGGAWLGVCTWGALLMCVCGGVGTRGYEGWEGLWGWVTRRWFSEDL